MTHRHFTLTARLIARYGGTATLQEQGDHTGPDWDPQPGVPVDHTVHLVETGAEQDLLPGTTIQAADLIAAMLPPADVVPSTAHRLIVGSLSMAIISVKPVRTVPDGPVLHFVIQARA